MFDRFWRADRARSGGGTGLGLAIAKRVLLGHNGDIELVSSSHEGTTLRVTIPLARG